MRPRTNRKGAVLLTVICFTTVCLMIATMALSAATVTMKRSNSNVRKTQAGITAQNYLDQFLKVYEKSDSSGNITYDDLKTVATGTSVNAPSKFNAAIQGSSTNVGDCQVSVYQVSGGIVVESSCTYAGETEVASAYFKTKSEPFSSTNVIEANGSFSPDATAIYGPTLIDGSATQDIYFTNDRPIKGDFYTAGNITFNTQKTVTTGSRGYAFTVTSGGYIKLSQNGNFQYTSGTRTTQTNASGEVEYLNRNGYLYSMKKVFITTDGSPNIGASGDPVDIYSYGMYVGSVPQTVKKDGVTVDVKDYNAINSSVGAGGQGNNFNSMHGNIYCYKGSNPDHQDGNIVFNNNGTSIDGSIYTDGDIYILQNMTLTANEIHCKGEIYDYNGKKYDKSKTPAQNKQDGFNATINASVIDSTFDKSKARNQMPDANYDPSRFDKSDLSDMGKYNPTRSSTSVYKDRYTANDMFMQNTVEAKNIQTLYKEAYSNTKIDTTYRDSAKISVPDGSGGWREETDDEYRARKIKENVQDWADYYYLDEACTQTLTSALMDCNDQNDWNNNKKNQYKTLYVKDNVLMNFVGSSLNFTDKIWGNWDTTLYQDNELRIVVKVQKDMVIILPTSVNTNNYGGSDYNNSAIKVDFSGDAKDSTTNLPKHFVHYMMDCGPNGDLYNVKYDASNPVPSSLPTWEFNKFTIYDNYTTSPADFTNKDSKENNIFILVPDEVDVRMYQCSIKAIIYGPKSDISIDGSTSGNTGVAYYGQAFVRDFIGTATGTGVSGLLPTEGSILEFINASNDSAVTLQYFAEVA